MTPRRDPVPMPELHDDWLRYLRSHSVSRRTVMKGFAVGAAGSLLAAGLPATLAGAATAGAVTLAGGFLVNGRHLSFGDDPQPRDVGRRAAVQPEQVQRRAAGSVKVWLEYGRDRSYGHTVEAEIRELLTHVPVWDGKPGVLQASRTLNADQFFVHAHLTGLPRHRVPLPVPVHLGP